MIFLSSCRSASISLLDTNSRVVIVQPLCKDVNVRQPRQQWESGSWVLPLTVTRRIWSSLDAFSGNPTISDESLPIIILAIFISLKTTMIFFSILIFLGGFRKTLHCQCARLIITHSTSFQLFVKDWNLKLSHCCIVTLFVGSMEAYFYSLARCVQLCDNDKIDAEL